MTGTEETTVRPRVMRLGRSNSRTVFQLNARIQNDGATALEVLDKGVGLTLGWVGQKFPDPIPERSTWRDSFDVDHHGQQSLFVTSLTHDQQWSARLIQPDFPFNGRRAVAGRTWVTEIALAVVADQVEMGVRVQCVSTENATEPIALTRPRLVLDFANELNLVEVRQISDEPWILKNESDLESLEELLTSNERTMPVVLLTEPKKGDLPWDVQPFFLEHRPLARALQGYAHVVCVSDELARKWAGRVGRVWAAYGGAIRTYYPGVDFESGSVYDHPRIMPDRVVCWGQADEVGEVAFATFLRNRLREHASTKRMDWGALRFHVEARARKATLDREHIERSIAASDQSSQLEALKKAQETETAALRDQLERMEQDSSEWESMASQYAQENTVIKAERRNLQIQNDALRQALEEKSGKSTDSELQVPNAYDEIPEWVEESMAGRLVLHPRALAGLKKASYGEIDTVGRALLLLANVYRSMKLGTKTKEEWESSLREYGLDCGPSIGKGRAGEQGDAYYVTSSTGERVLMDMHIRKGTTKDDRFCLRIYFYWDASLGHVVVGWLPSHLRTRAS